MESRIGKKLNELKEKKKKALITYITSGDPSLANTMELVLTMEKAGADIIELGIPYSDPLADGLIVGSEIIKQIEKGIELGNIEGRVFELVKSFKQAIDE